jgi:hypothetical protein
MKHGADMDLGSVTLLEINQVPDGKRVAYCLPSGEFVFASAACATAFDAESAAELYGANVYEFLALADAERLQDYTRAHYKNGTFLCDGSSEMRLMLRVAGSPARPNTVWTHLVTIPLTLRLLRCIDALHCLNPRHSFADSSSFELTEDELSALFHNTPPTALELAADCEILAMLNEAEMCLSMSEGTAIVPLELQNVSRAACFKDDAEDGVMNDSSDYASLASLAFEADWADEMDDALLAPSAVA